MVYGSIFENLRNTIIKWAAMEIQVNSGIFDFIA
jgi:hypothetical protein